MSSNFHKINNTQIHTDNTLLNLWKKGDMAAFKMLYQKYSIRLLETAYKKIQNFQEAEEIVQDAFLAFYNNRDKVADNPYLYLQGILRHKIFDYKRKASTAIISLTDTIPLADKSENITWENIKATELHSKISFYTNQLPKQCKTAFMLSRQEQLSYSEISSRMGISAKTVESHISKALKYLREHMDYSLTWLVWLIIVFSH